jgi:hypothetical protein
MRVLPFVKLSLRLPTGFALLSDGFAHSFHPDPERREAEDLCICS